MSDPAGIWDLTVATPFGDQQLVFEIVVDGESVSGAANHSSGRFPFDGGTYRNDKVEFEVSLTAPVTADLKVKLQADGDTISGTAKAGLIPAFQITGTRARPQAR